MTLAADKADWLARFGLTAKPKKAKSAIRRASVAAPVDDEMEATGGGSASADEPMASGLDGQDANQSSSGQSADAEEPTASYQEYPVSGTPPAPPPSRPAPRPRAPAPSPRRPPPPPEDEPEEQIMSPNPDVMPGDEDMGPNMTPNEDGPPPAAPWVDPRENPEAYDTPPPAPPKPRQPAPPSEPGKLDNGAPGVTEAIEVSLKSEGIKGLGGKIEVVFKVTGTLSAAFLPKEGTQIQVGYNTKEGIALKAAQNWALKNLMKDLGAPSWLEKSKFSLEGESTEKGISVKAGFAVELSWGTIKLAGVLLKIETGKTASYGAVEVSYQTPKLPLQDWVEDNIQVSQVTLSVKAQATIQPQYAKLLAEELIKDAGIAAAETGTTGAASGGVAAIDIALSAALVGVAVGTAVGVARMFAERANINDLRGSVATALGELRGGLYQGAAGGDPAGSGELYKQGYDIGLTAYKQATKLIWEHVDPPPPPDEFGALARKLASGAVGKWSGFTTFENEIRWSLFRRWVADNHGFWDNEAKAQRAVQECFGVANEPITGPHMSYWAKMKEAD